MIKILYSSELIKHELPILATEKYLKAVTNYKYGWFMSDDFLLPFLIQKISIFKALVFTHDTIYLKKDIFKEDEKEFLNGVVLSVKRMKYSIDFISQPFNSAIFSTFPEKAIACKFGTYQIDLEKSEETLFSNIHRKHRPDIRKAQKENISIFEGSEYIDVCVENIKETMTSQNMSYVSKNKLRKLSEELSENVSFYISKKNDVVQSCLVVVWKENDTAYCVYGGGSISQNVKGAVKLMYWETMKQMKKNGVKTYDFVGARISPSKGSKKEGIQRFKLRFGATMKVGYLWKYPVRPFRYRLFKIAVNLKSIIRYKKFDKGDIIDEEIRNAKCNINI